MTLKNSWYQKKVVVALLVTLFVFLTFSTQSVHAALSPENPPIENATDQQCATAAQGNSGLVGFSLFMSPVSIVDNSWGEVTYRTYVCNGSNNTITKDETLTKGRGIIYTAPIGVANGGTNVFDYSQTGWANPVSSWYTQDMGSYGPHAWRYRDVTFRVDGTKFPTSGLYRVRVDGRARVTYAGGLVTQTNEVAMYLNLTVVKTKPSTCTVNGPSQVVAPGTQRTVSIRVFNGGNTPGHIDWNTNNLRLGSNPADGLTSPSPALITPTSGIYLPMNQSSSTQVTFTAPSSPGIYTLSWQLQDSSGNWYPDILNPCVTTITVGDNPAQTFSCVTGFYQIAEGILHSIDPLTGNQTVRGSTGMNRIQAIGYNVNDGFMYGVERATSSSSYDNYLVKIAADGSASRIMVPRPSPPDAPTTRPNGAVPGTRNTIAGDMDPDGNLWYLVAAPGTEIIKLNVQTLTYRRYQLTQPVGTSDIVYRDGVLYGLNTSSSRVIRIDTRSTDSAGRLQTSLSNAVTNLPPSLPAYVGVSPAELTSLWTTDAGRIYGLQRSSGRILEIERFTGNAPNIKVLANTPSGYTIPGNTDGASCPEAEDPYVDPDTPPFKCEAVFYQTLITFGTRFTKLNINDNGTYTDIKSVMDVPNINAIGYNIEDNHIYGFSLIDNRNQLRRIDALGNTTQIPLKNQNTNSDFVSSGSIVVGDFDSSGNLWVILTGSGVYRIDVDSGGGVARAYPAYGNNAWFGSVQDWVLIGDSFYGVYSNGTNVQLVRVQINGTSVTSVTFKTFTPSSSPPVGAPYGALWTNKSNRLYASFNNGGIYEIKDYAITPTSSSPSMNHIIDTVATGGNDGASCPNAEDLFEERNYPFLRVNGSDVIAGVGFKGLEGADSCEVHDGSIRTNGMKRHAYNSTETEDILSGSSSVQYGAFAFGQIDSGLTELQGSFLANNGYYRQQSGAVANYRRDVLFGNSGNAAYGNYYNEESIPCIDVGEISKRATETLDPAAVASTITSAATGNKVYRVNGSFLVAQPITIPTENQVTLIVDGGVGILANITYANPHMEDGVPVAPSLTIIAKDGISVAENVTDISGYYLAYNSTLNTCASYAADKTPRTGICNQQLRVNGGLAGKKIEWRRNFGTLKTDASTLPSGAGVRCAVATVAGGDVNNVTAALNQCAAERIDFNPLYYFSNPFAYQVTSSQISGAPLSSTELPPIY